MPDTFTLRNINFIVNYSGVRIPFTSYFPNEQEVAQAQFLQFHMLRALSGVDVTFEYKLEIAGKAICECYVEQRFEERFEELMENRKNTYRIREEPANSYFPFTVVSYDTLKGNYTIRELP